MYLEENIRRLNARFSELPIRFEMQGNILLVREESPFYLNQNEPLKRHLQEKYKMKFRKTLLWHIDADGLAILSKSPIKESPSIAAEELKSKMMTYLSQIEEKELRETTTQIYELYHKFLSASAAVYIHHNYKYGLLEHSIQTLEMSLSLIDKMHDLDPMRTVDKDLIIAGALLHDIGKINRIDEINGAYVANHIYSEQDHIINGIKLISQTIRSPKLDALIHIVASHHNIKEWGSPISPQSYEAWIIHSIENLSSKILG